MNKKDHFRGMNPELENRACEISDEALDQVVGGFLSAGDVIMKRCNRCGQTARHNVLANSGGNYKMRCSDCGAEYWDDWR